MLDSGGLILNSSRDDRRRPGAFSSVRLPFFNRVFDTLTLGQIVERLVGHGRMMEEDVLSAFGLNETETLLRYQLFDLT